MKAVDVIKRAVEFVGDLEMESIFTSINYGDTLTYEQQQRMTKYINGVNLAVDTIASRYYSSVGRKKVVSDAESKIYYSDLDSRVYEVVKVVNRAGEVVEHYALPFSLLVPNAGSSYEVVFKYLPSRVNGLNDEIEILPFVNERAVAMLLASDLCLSAGQYTESKFWFSKFEGEMSQAVTSRRMRTLAVSRLL